MPDYAIDLGDELLRRRKPATARVRDEAAGDGTAPDALLRDGGRARRMLLEGADEPQAVNAQAMADAGPQFGGLHTLAERIAANPNKPAAELAGVSPPAAAPTMYDFAGRSDRGRDDGAGEGYAAGEFGRSLVEQMMQGKPQPQPAQRSVLDADPAQPAGPPQLSTADLYRGGTGQFRFGQAMDNGVVVNAAYTPDGRRMDDSGLPLGMQVGNARERAYNREVGAASLNDIDRQSRSLPLIDFQRNAERASRAGEFAARDQLGAASLDQGHKKSLLDAAIDRERIAAQQQIADQQFGSRATQDRFRQGVGASLIQNPAYLAADPGTKRQMEADAARLAGQFGGRPAGPQAAPPPGGAAPGVVDPEEVRRQSLASVLEAAKKSIASTKPASAPGLPGQPGYEYTPDRASGLLDALADGSLTPEQRRQVMDQLAATPGLNVQQLGDAMVQATVNSMFATTPQRGGGQGMPATITSPDLPGLQVGGGDDLGYGLTRWLGSGFNPGSLYDSANLYGRTVPLQVGQTGFQRAALPLIESERHKARVRAAAELLPHLNRSGLYGERPTPLR